MISPTSNKNRRSHMLVPVLLSACAIPISMLFWMINVLYSIFYSNSENHFEGMPEYFTIVSRFSFLRLSMLIVFNDITIFSGHLVVSPWRWLVAVLLPIFMSFWGLRRKSVDVSGAVLGIKIFHYFYRIKNVRHYLEMKLCVKVMGIVFN